MSFWEKHKGYIIIISTLVFIGIVCYIISLVTKEKVITYVPDGEETNFLQNYKVNQVIPVYVTEEQIVSIYFNDYINKILYNREEAYALLEKKFKKDQYKTFEEYDQAMNKLQEKASSFSMSNYTVKKGKYITTYRVQDNNDNLYIFNVTAVMVYTVQFTTAK